MKRVTLLSCTSPLAGLIIGFCGAFYLVDVCSRYREAYFSAMGGLLRLEMLDSDYSHKLRDMEGLGIISGCATMDALPDWARRFTPNRAPLPPSEGQIQTWLEIVQTLRDSKSNRSYISYFGLTDDDFERIFRTHLVNSSDIRIPNNLEKHWRTWKDVHDENDTEPPRPAGPSSAAAPEGRSR